jgi:hypothetical protein
MTYQSAPALRTALERRLLARSAETGVSLDRLRRRVMFERIIAAYKQQSRGNGYSKVVWHLRFAYATMPA